MSSCNSVGLPDSIELTNGGARFCGVSVPPLPNFASCCAPNARVYNGSEVVVSNPGSQEGANNSTTPYAGCISYCNTDATASEFGDCVRGLSNGVNLDVFCGRGQAEESTSSATSSPFPSSNDAFSSRLQVNISPVTALTCLLFLSHLLAL